MDTKFSGYPDIGSIQPGKLSLWCLAKLLECVGSVVIGNFFAPTYITKDTTLFVATRRIEFKPLFYQKRFLYEACCGVATPLRFYYYVSHIGNTSYTVTHEWIDNKTGELIVKSSTKAVLVNKTTRKPKPIPDMHGLNEHRQCIKDNTVLEKPDPVVIPDNAFKHTLKALHSECDSNDHINQASYVSWCSDAASLGAIRGHFKNYTKHIERYQMKDIVVHYLGEAHANNIVTVNVWEGGKSGKQLMFAVLVCEKVVFFMHVDMYDSLPVDVSPHLESML
ncbi:uncharacterized protein LOC128235280 isoform X2 [Mya arenaria]|uniref:uncharacterized protein LOC128235280 isoform X2 n=1 Tax=Mya arenaria TaxID=6604 RepID=UPI0022E2B09D|nr:uncharacterized protein LOC128235280 isoform X2 [Mya arenaria]